LPAVGVSSVTGDGFTEFFAAVDASRAEYETDYLSLIDEKKKLKEEKEEKARATQRNKSG
jgi:hypothetical protein